MMFTSLMIAAILSPPQDAEAESRDTDSAEAVATFLDAAAGKLYDPVGDGLEALQFSVPFELPANPARGYDEPLRIATFNVGWTKADGTDIHVTMADGVDPTISSQLAAAGMTAEALEKTTAQQPLLYALNLNIDASMMDGGFIASIESTEAEGTSLKFLPKASDVGVNSIVWDFGADGVLKSKTTEAPGPMGKSKTIETYTWRDAPGDEGLLVEEIRVVQDLGMIKVAGAIVPEYRQVGELTILAGYVQRSEGLPAMSVPASEMRWRFEGLVVNGTPLETSPSDDAGSKG